MSSADIAERENVPSSTSAPPSFDLINDKELKQACQVGQPSIERNIAEKSLDRDHSEEVLHKDQRIKNSEIGVEGLARTGDDFPDGGLRAWLVIVGIFQAYYEETILKDSSPSTICSALLVAATFLIAQCMRYWQFLLCQGIAVGLAAGGIFGSRSAVLAHWFKKKRGFALGFTATGSSISGTLFPIIAKALIPRVGQVLFPWTIRILGFILLVAAGICNLTMKRRLPPVNVKGGLLNLAAFKEIPYTLYCISAFLNFLGLYTMLTYVNVSVAQLGATPEVSFYFVAFANAASLFGRLVAGVLADMAGPLNITVPFTLCAGILIYTWPFAHSTASLIIVTLIYGFCSGTYVALLSAPIINLGGEGDVGRRVGMLMTFIALGSVVGPPISGAINAKTGGFEGVGLYAGSTVVIGVGCMITVRFLVLGKWTGKL
ncbi:Riboflavin transporter MCH5 [Leucoagaricus sp. SymC.cos]|nr:Riboflavin transporter MCH5 [Leucoagaricus sp. SymC.cos]